MGVHQLLAATSSSKELVLLKHWTLQYDEQGIAWLGLAVHQSKVNVLHQAMMLELEQICQHLKQNKPLGFVIFSNKPDSFLAGVDLRFFELIKDQLEFSRLAQQARDIFACLAQLPIPSVSLIDGACLGSGIELALLTTYRIASDSPKTIFGCPEIASGFHLGFGGTVRIMEHMGASAAMDMMLKGYQVSVQAALQKGLVDAICPASQLKASATHYLLKRPHRVSVAPFSLLLDNILVRPWLVAKWRKRLIEQNIKPEHYPAPYALLQLWSSKGRDYKAMYEAEAQSVHKLVFSEQSHNLIRLQFLKSRLKTFSRHSNFNVGHVHIIGAGMMGRAIAAWCVSQGCRVSLQDTNETALTQAISYVHDFLQKNELNSEKIPNFLAQLKADPKGTKIATADAVIEALPDKLAAKQEVLAWIEEQARPQALLATTTSILPFDKLAAVLLKPKRLVGLHFLNPIERLSLVEVVYQPHLTDNDEINKASAFVKQLNKLALPIHSTAGYLINRIMFAYILQGIRLYQQHVPHTVIDKAGIDFGMPMGPLQLADLYGLDYCRQLGELLAKTYQVKLPELVITMANSGKLGQKSGTGFYRYRYGKMMKPEREAWDGNVSALQDKLINQMLEEAALCLEQGIVEDQDLLDVAVVCGTGFAPFRGGPLHYALTLRKDSLLKESALESPHR